MNRNQQIAAAAAAVVALVLAFGGGFLTGKGQGGGGGLFGGSSYSTAKGGGGTVAKQSVGMRWFGFGRPRGANAPRPGAKKPDGFAVWSHRIDTSGPGPVNCIRMTRPLDPAKAYSDYVLVSPDLGGTPAVSVRGGDQLCVGGVGFVDRRITLLKGLPSKSGETLAANADVDFVFGDKPPYVGFAGDGVILPREEGDGVGIETVNVQRLNIEVWRVPDRNLVRRSIAAVDPAGEGEYLSDWDSRPDDEGRVVWRGQIPVRGQVGERATTVFPLGAVLKELKPGGYVIKASDGTGRPPPSAKSDDDGDSDGQPARAQRWIIFTDMALLSYSGSDGVDAVVRSLKTAKPMGGVRVALVARNGEDLAWASSDNQGRVRFPKPLFKGEAGDKAKMLMAYGPQADLAVLDLDRSPVDLSKQGVGGRAQPGEIENPTAGRTAKTAIDAYLYADRGIYRPGETVHLVAMIRDLQGKAVKNRKGTLTIKRPSGVEFLKVAFDGAPSGAIARDLVLPKTAPRGRWVAEIRMDGMDEESGRLAFSVEDFAPQRLEVKANGAENRPVTGGEARRIEVSSRFLYGAPGAGLQVQGEARLRPDHNPFPQFGDYQWGDQQTAFEEKQVELTQTVTDGDGRAFLSLGTQDAGDTSQPLVAAVTASVFEPGGRPVKEGLSLKVRPKPVYLGVKVNQGEGNPASMSFDVIAVDAFGRRMAAPGTTYTLISENWDYDWFQQDGRWQWRRNSRDAVVIRGVLNVASDLPAKLAKRLGWGDYRLVLEGPQGAKTIIRFAAGWGSPAKDSEAPDMVRVSAGARTYGQGDTVEVTLKAPYAGQAQIAVATDRIIDLKTVAVPAGGTTIRLKTSPEWGGGAYVLATVIQPRDPVASPRPRRALGLVYVPLDPRARKLAVDIGTPDKIDSKDGVSIPVKVNGLKLGQRAYVTVAAIDEGILQLTKQESPDPVKWYFGKRSLSVDYRDDYGRLLDPNLGPPALFNFGGDEIGGEGLTVTPIKTVALWSGVVQTGLDGKAVVKLPAAGFNGKLRLMAVAWTDEAVGAGQKTMTVREPVVADLNLPRFLAPGDSAIATLELHNVEGKPGPYTYVVNAVNGVVANVRKVVNLILGQRLVERIPIAAPNVAGISKVSFNVTGPGFNTSKDYDIQTRLGWGPETRTFTALQRPNDPFTPNAALMAGLAAGTVTMEVSYSPFRGFDPGPIALSLSRYPYGCTEQIVSIAYPLLYAQEVSSDPKLRHVGGALNAAVGKLLDRQTLDGAFGLWRVGDGEADPWLGAYITDFLIEAQKKGAAVPQVAIDRALNAMRLVSKPDGFASVAYRMEYPEWWAGNPEASKKATERMRSRASAYALYVMAKGGRGDLARLRWYHDVQFKQEASPLARAQVGAGLALMGDKARARSAIRQAISALGYKDKDDWYQSELRDLGAVIAYAHEAGELQQAQALQTRLQGVVKDPDLLNTQEQARLLQAADRMLKAAGRIRIEASGVTALPALGGVTRWSVGKLADARFVNKGSGALWRTVTVRGVPTASPPATGQGLSVSKRYLTFTGAPADPSNLTQGDKLIVLITGDSAQGRTLPLVIDDALPAGFEVDMTLSPDDAQNGPFKFLGTLASADVQEARDDRYVAAMDVQGGKAFALAYVARAVTPGDFYLPGVVARDMYKPQVFSRSVGSRAKIAPAG